MNLKHIKILCRNFGRDAEIILNNEKHMGFKDWSYDFVTLDESREEEFNNNTVNFYFISGGNTIFHPVNLVVLDSSPDWVVGEFYKEIHEYNKGMK
ncbi:hypothetical protein ZPAH1_orf00336 [Aeromonas phage ZPAH1]|nr:hypothetical protein ASwh1_290 [Aeromonas phage Aswh_1]QQG34098.1 hypothetical protein ZPAH1_orf00336 [Aeromonas phage ZPAH1]